MRNLTQAPIKTFVHGIYDGPHATPKESVNGPVFLGIDNVTPEGRLDLTQIRHIAEEDYPKWTRRVTPQPNDIVFSYEATLHRYALIPEGFRGCLGRRMALVRPDTSKLNPRYLHYYFLSPRWRAVVESNIISGATVDRVPLKNFPSFGLSIPPLEDQDKIAGVLDAYDDLIENNRRRIRLLEEPARLLYKEWFVHLRFPGREHVKIVDGVPEGWQLQKIAEVANTVGGGTPSTKISEYWENGDITWFVPSDLTKNDCLVLLGSEKKITEVGLKKSSARMLPPDTILMTSRATIGYFGLYEKPACTNQGFISVIPHVPESGMYLLHNLIGRKEELEGRAGGTTYKEINKSTFRNMDILMPTRRLMEEFNDFALEMVRQIRVLKKQSEKLRQARDLLLPRLMSGEIAV